MIATMKPKPKPRSTRGRHAEVAGELPPGICKNLICPTNQPDLIRDARGKVLARVVNRPAAKPEDPSPKTSSPQESTKSTKGSSLRPLRSFAAKTSASTALVPATIDVLTDREDKDLARAEIEIDRSRKKSLEGFVAMGRAITDDPRRAALSRQPRDL